MFRIRLTPEAGVRVLQLHSGLHRIRRKFYLPWKQSILTEVKPIPLRGGNNRNEETYCHSRVPTGDEMAFQSVMERFSMGVKPQNTGIRGVGARPSIEGERQESKAPPS